MSSGWLSEQHQAIYYSVLSSSSLVYAGFFKENVRYPVWICRVPISLILGTRFSLILGTR